MVGSCAGIAVLASTELTALALVENQLNPQVHYLDFAWTLQVRTNQSPSVLLTRNQPFAVPTPRRKLVVFQSLRRILYRNISSTRTRTADGSQRRSCADGNRIAI